MNVGHELVGVGGDDRERANPFAPVAEQARGRKFSEFSKALIYLHRMLLEGCRAPARSIAGGHLD
jgi:hypothetical protein